MDAVRDPIVLWEAEISSFLPIWTLFARNDFEIDKKPYVIEKMIFFLFMGTEFFYKYGEDLNPVKEKWEEEICFLWQKWFWKAGLYFCL